MNAPLCLRFLFLALLLGRCEPAAAQEQRYDLALRGVPLAQALAYFSRATGTAISYDPSLVQGHRAYCVAEREKVEAILQCLLAETDLDYVRLSSGTYVLNLKTELHARYGSLSGTAADRETGSPLPDAHVLLAQANLGTVTNRAGQFVFPPLLPGSYAITISHVSYQDWQDTLWVAAGAGTQAHAALQARPVLISPVIVDGLQPRFSSENLLRAQVSVEAPPVGFAGASGTALQSLQTLAGIHLNDITADVHLQGGDAGEHQLRLDGVPVFLPAGTLGVLGPFSPFAVERITVHKAGFDADQGSQIAGVIQVEHAVEAARKVDVQLDPLSLNTRLQWNSPADDRSGVTLMAAGRFGLWDVYPSPRLQSTLSAWSAPDPFLIFGPLRRYEYATPAFFTNTLGIASNPFPALHFSDLHAAARVRFSPLRTLFASAYQGQNRLQGTLLGSANLDRQLAGRDGAALSVFDAYRWTNRTGQMRYDAVLGSHALLNLQARGSTYHLSHGYEVLDSLEVFAAGSSSPTVKLSTTRVDDTNRVQEFALSGTLDYARAAHQVELGAEAMHTASRFDLLTASVPDFAEFSDLENSQAGYAGVGTNPQTIPNLVRAWRFAAYVEDEVALGDRTSATFSLRLTYLPNRNAVYAEPRASFRYDHPDGPFGAWSSRTAIGVYRQFVNQMDVSKLNAGALLPSVRIWLPVDGTVRPPLAYHLAQAFLFLPSPGWTVRLEGYLKEQPHGLVLNYPLPDSARPFLNLSDQAYFLTGSRGRAYGSTLSVEWRSRLLRTQALYDYSHATRTSATLFDGRTEPVPWNEPHRLLLAFDWLPLPSLTASMRWHGVWGRAWGFRRAYYDYLAQAPETRSHGSYDFGRPSEHVLPPLYQLDLSVAYTFALRAARLQLRADVLNVLSRENVADWRLVYREGSLHKEARPLYGIMPALAVHLSW